MCYYELIWCHQTVLKWVEKINYLWQDDSTNSSSIVRGTRFIQPDFSCLTSLSVAFGKNCTRVTESVTKDKRRQGGGNNSKEEGQSQLWTGQGQTAQRQLPVKLRLCADVWFHWYYRTGCLPEQSPGWGGKVKQEKISERSRKVNTMKFHCRRTRSRGLVSTTTTMTMIMTCAVYWAKYLLQDIKEYVPDLIPTTGVLNLLRRCFRNWLEAPRPE